MTTGFDVVTATHSLVERALAAPRADRPTRVVSAKVARQMLHLLGDNEQWTEVPTAREMDVWRAIRHAEGDLLEELRQLFPEQCEAMRHSLKHWGHGWLRGIVEESEQAWRDAGVALDAIAAEDQAVRS